MATKGFASHTDSEIETKKANVTPKATKDANGAAAKVLKEYLKEIGQDCAFEEFSKERLNELLTHFYLDVRTKQGNMYKMNSLESLRHGINRYLRAPPFSKKFDILKDSDFLEANESFKTAVKELKAAGPFNGDCNFETSLSQCQWKQSTGDDGDWMIAQTTVNGPKRDHRNTATGKFIYMDSSLQSPGDGVRVQTPFFPASHGVCYMRFWYFMFGSPRMGPLKVFLQNRYGNTTDLVWEMTGSQGTKWKNVNIPIGSAQDFSVIFEATRGDQDHSDIALDDVSFTPECGTGASPTSPSHAVCYQGTFYCAPKKQCFPNSWKCDGVQDCPDGSDEPSTCPTTPPVTGTVSSRGPKSLPVTSALPTTTTHVIKNTCAASKYQCNDGSCIPLLLLCDAIADCPDGSDEKPSNCPIKKCDVGFYYCKQQRQCINGTRCDGHNDCGDQTDESVCGNACPPNFCQSGSVCQTSGVKTLSCSCPKGLNGIRCQYRETSVLRHSSNSPASSSSGWKAGVGVTVALVCIIGIVGAGYFLWRRQKQRNFNQRLGGLSNPSYDGGDMHDFQMEDPFQGLKMTSDATSIENPLYQDATA